MIDFNELSIIRLSVGAHTSAKEGVCAMEAVAWLEGLEHTDHPSCTCPVIAAFVRGINDSLPDDERQRLQPYLPRLVGTVSAIHEQERAEWLAWYTITVITPKALEKIGLSEYAAALKALARHDWDAAVKAARAAEWAAARAAQWTTARAARDAECAASRAAEWATAKAAARDTAWAAARAAEWAARDAARAAARAGGWAAAKDAANDADWQLVFNMLDGVLAIGPTGGFTQDISSRIAAYRQQVLERA